MDLYLYKGWERNNLRRSRCIIRGHNRSWVWYCFGDLYRFPRGYVKANPAEGVEGFPENRRSRYLTDNELERILSSMTNSHRDMFRALYFTAQRPGRIYRLKWQQIDLKKRSIAFENTSDNKRVPAFIWINDTLFRILSRYKSTRRVLTPYVFYKPSLKPFSEFDARKIWKRAAEKAGVEDTRPYDLRHKAITDMMKAGFNDAQVGHVVAHSDPRTTKRYTHLSVEETQLPLQSLADRMKMKRASGDEDT